MLCKLDSTEYERSFKPTRKGPKGLGKIQNVIQMQLHGGKNPIVLVLYWEMIQMKLQDQS